MRKQRAGLFLESASDFRITNEKGLTVLLVEARRRWEAGEVKEWNLAFARLISEGFNLPAVIAYYVAECKKWEAKNDRQRVHGGGNARTSPEGNNSPTPPSHSTDVG